MAAHTGDVTCPCGKTFAPKPQGRRPTFCSAACRSRSRRGGFRTPVVVRLSPGKGQSGKSTSSRTAARSPKVKAGAMTAAVEAELKAVDRLSSSIGQSALFLARSIDNVDTGVLIDSGASRASMVRELTKVMDVATRVAEGAKGDELTGIEDEVAAARARHR